MKKYEDFNLIHGFPEVELGNDYIIATYQVITATKDIHKLASAIADEQSTGTWTKVKYETAEKKRKFGAKVCSIYEIPPVNEAFKSDEKAYIIQVAFPTINIPAEFSMLLTTVMGNIASSGKMKLIDLAFPESYVKGFSGPRFGIDGLRDALGVYDRPLLNCMIKPNIGWTPDEGAELFYEAAVGGCDVIKDDELLAADLGHCPLKERVTKFMAAEKRAFEETGEHTLYTVNVTGDGDTIRDNAYRALEYGANALMVNFYTAGFPAAKMLASDPNINVPILAHIDFAGAYMSSPYYGLLSDLLVGKLSRLAGADLEIFGTPYGKFPGGRLHYLRVAHFFTQPWYNIKPTMFCASGGTTQAAVPYIMGDLGIDIVIAAGGGVHGHPNGSRAGATAMREAIDATIKGISLEEYAKTHPELAVAIDVWGGDIQSNFDLMK